MALTKADWQSAIDVQDACNLSGVVHSLVDILSSIRSEKDFSGTAYVNRHPIVVLYVNKLASLTGDNFSEAYAKVQAKLAELSE
jgi:hypothetical protein